MARRMVHGGDSMATWAANVSQLPSGSFWMVRFLDPFEGKNSGILMKVILRLRDRSDRVCRIFNLRRTNSWHCSKHLIFNTRKPYEVDYEQLTNSHHSIVHVGKRILGHENAWILYSQENEKTADLFSNTSYRIEDSIKICLYADSCDLRTQDIFSPRQLWGIHYVSKIFESQSVNLASSWFLYSSRLNVEKNCQILYGCNWAGAEQPFLKEGTADR